MHNVLEDVVDKEAGAKPKLVGPSGSVGSAVRHIAQGELDAYVEGRLAGARLDFVRNHLDACEACRAELEDLRTFKATAVGQSQASTLKRELERRRRQRQLKAAATAAVAAAVVAAVGVVGWDKYGKAWVHTHAQGGAQAQIATGAVPQQASAAAAAIAQASAPARTHIMPVATANQLAVPARDPSQARATVQMPAQVSDANAASGQLSGSAQTRVAVAAPAATPNQLSKQSRVASAASATAQPLAETPKGSTAQGQAAALSAEAPVGSNTFALLGPFGDEVNDDRPEFAWQPLAGATKYSIIIVDEGLRPIAHTRLKTTTWRPHKPLRRGRSYLWQVTAILKNGTKVMATGPTSQEARIHIGAPPK